MFASQMVSVSTNYMVDKQDGSVHLDVPVNSDRTDFEDKAFRYTI